LEYLGRTAAGGVLDRRVAVDEGQAQPLGEAAPHRRLAYPHQSDQHDWPVKALPQIHNLKGLYSGLAARQKREPCPALQSSSSSSCSSSARLSSFPRSPRNN